MYLRIVRTTIAPGQEADYWAWSREILDLWDEHGIVRAGGPYVTTAATGEEVALWLTVHRDEPSLRGDFREMYSTPRGQELIARRPALVSATDVLTYPDWDQSEVTAAGPPPAL